MNDFERAASIGYNGKFNSLKMVDDMHVFTINEGMKEENSDKNRYRNILPYDQTRVILRKSNEHQSDYINANYVRSPRMGGSSSSVQSSNKSLNCVNSLVLRSNTRKTMPLVTKSSSDDALREVKRKRERGEKKNLLRDKLYIATQGCLPNTVNDFWRMVWQEDVRVITMITNEVEKGKKKCECYWPASGQEVCYDELLVKSTSERRYEHFVLREFDVSDEDTCRIIYHYQYTSWPDHGAPRDPSGVLAWIDDINRRMYRIAQETDAPERNVLCVHCSAAARTGTFIALDMLIDEIKRSGLNCEIDVHSTVKLVRAQRYGMVLNKAQYKFLYLAVQNYIDNNNIKRKKVVQSTSEA